ncbi:MAG: HDOD domain-containing protein [Acidimicrobiia bacterium]|nr:HDOD domain-containing protein [Acidimicrobiia bacterium]
MTTQIDRTRGAYVGRQPVFDRHLEVVAYELLLRDGPVSSIESRQANGSRLVLGESVDVDVDAITRGMPVHIPVSSHAIQRGLPERVGPTMLSLGASVPGVDSIADALRDAAELGYGIVIDDWTNNRHLHGLLEEAAAIRLSLGQLTGKELRPTLEALRMRGKVLIADHVNSYEHLREARKLGFDRYQGSFLSRPDVLRKRAMKTTKLAALGLIALLNDPDASITHMAELIRRDVALSYRILRVVNSAFYALPRQVDSIEDAVMIVGTKQLGSWVGLLKMHELSDKPTELTVTAMVRAHVCEAVAEAMGRPDPQSFYTVGLFSVLEAMLDTPASDLLETLSLSEDIVAALLSGSGPMGEVLRAVIAYEEGNWADAELPDVDDTVIGAAFQSAMEKTTRMWRQAATSDD